MKKKFVWRTPAVASFLIFILILPGLSTLDGMAAQSQGNILFGDFNVDESQITGLKPETFYVILYMLDGNVVARQSITNHGRYKFLNVPNGQYNLVVEVENQEVARIALLIRELRPTDVRRDLNLEWRETGIPRRPVAATTVSVAAEYKRSAANQTKFNQALAEAKKKNYASAMALFGDLVRTDPRDFIAWTELGTAQFREGQVIAAAQSYLQALQSRPNFPLALLNLSKLRMTQKNYDSAIELLTRAVQTPPPSAEANQLLGECYLQIKKGSKAVSYLNEALRLDPLGKADVHLRLAVLYNGANLKDKAAAEYEKFLEKKPDYPDKQKLLSYIAENGKK